MEERIRLICDRVEEGIAVLLSDDGRSYEIPAETLPDSSRAEGKSFLCTVKNGTVDSLCLKLGIFVKQILVQENLSRHHTAVEHKG